MRRIVSCCVAAGALFAVAAPSSASAADNFTCRGSAARVQAPVVNLVEPVRANTPNDPCANESNTLLPISIGTILKAPTANAVTTNSATSGTSFGSVENAEVAISTGLLGTTSVGVKADVIEAKAATSCTAAGPSVTGSSRIAGLALAVKVAGLNVPVNIPVNPAPNTVLVNLLGVKITLNEQTGSATDRTYRALRVQVGSTIDVIVAEARAGYKGSPCAPPAPPQCSDGVDNGDAEDTLADINDPGCHSDSNPNNPGSYNPNDDNETDEPQCSNGKDDDGDGSTDFPADAGCDGPGDNNEKNQCSDGVDNGDSEDTLADANDPGCHSDSNPNNPGSYNPQDNDETDQPQCSNGKDDDGDGSVDFPADGGCTGPGDNNEKAQCQDGVDNADAEDTQADKADPGCHSDGNPYNDSSYVPNDDNESNTKTQCNDGVDNADTEDTLADINDPGCHTGNNINNPYDPNDNDEGNGAKPQCDDGIDNDMDGFIDFPNDPGCSSKSDNSESNGDPKTDCNDGIDNDDNGKTDYPNDPGCKSPLDDQEGDHNGDNPDYD